MHSYLRQATELDAQDQLSHFKQQFLFDKNVIYLDGNSLGRLPKKSVEVLRDVVENQWGNRLIRSWNEHWLDLPKRIATKLASIVGALPEEIFIGDSTSVNLYKLAFATLKTQSNRTEILTDSLNFPTDLYIFQELIRHSFPEHCIRQIPSVEEMTTSLEAINENLTLQTAVLSLSHVTYKSAFMYDMAIVNQLAKTKGAYTLWDLSHAVGAVALNLRKSGADMAVGCTYKYLNGGPGAPAFLYVRKELQEQLQNPIAGWFGHKNPFDFAELYAAHDGIQRFAAGTPTVLSMAGIEPGLDITNEAGIENLRQKSVRQSEFLLSMIASELVPLGFKIAAPLEATQRGSHISIQHQHGYQINRAMISPQNDAKAIIPDFRPPTNIRLGIAPLYNSFTDLAETVERLKAIVITKEYEQFSAAVQGVS